MAGSVAPEVDTRRHAGGGALAGAGRSRLERAVGPHSARDAVRQPREGPRADLPRRQAPRLDRPRREERAAGLGQDARAKRRQDGHHRRQSGASASTSGRGRQRSCSTSRTPTGTRTGTSSAWTSTRARSATSHPSGRARPDHGRPSRLPRRAARRAQQARPPALDVYRLNVSTGALTLDTENPGDVSAGRPTPEFQVRAAQAATPDGGTEIRDARRRQGADWRSWIKVGPGRDPRASSTSRPTASRPSSSRRSAATTLAWSERVLATGEEEGRRLLPGGRAGAVLVHPKKHSRPGRRLRAGPLRWRSSTPDVKADFDGLANLFDGRLRDRQPRRQGRELAGGLHLRPGPDPLLRLGTGEPEGHVPLRPPAPAGGPAAGHR